MKVRLKVTLGAVVLALTTSGCAMMSINNDMMDNAFLDQIPIENNVSGTYTASIGPFLTTYVIEQDGAGVYCYVANGTPILHKVKIYSKTDNNYSLITETGLKSTLSKIDSGSLAIDSYGNKFTLQSDENFAMANLFCREKLAGI